jgi:hypothetical protein
MTTGPRADFWQIGLSAMIATGLALLAAFWALADPRADIKEIKNNYLTLREHDEFVRRFTSDINRVEQTNREQAGEMARKVEVESHDRADADMRTAQDRRLDQMQRQIDLLLARSLIEPPPNLKGIPR